MSEEETKQIETIKKQALARMVDITADIPTTQQSAEQLELLQETVAWCERRQVSAEIA